MPSSPSHSGGALVKVAFARNQAEAEMIQGLLLESGIPSMLKRTRGFDVPDFLAAGPRDVLVQEQLAARARELLADTGAASGVEARSERGPQAGARGGGLSPARLAAVLVAALLAAALIVWILYELTG